MKNKLSIATICFFAAIFLFHTLTLMRYPAPFVDEAWFASRSWSYIKTGHVFGPLDAGVFDRFDGYWTFFPWLPIWIQSLSLRIVGSPSLLAVRLVSLVFGFLLLIAIYIIAKNLGGRSLGLLSVLLVSLSSPFMNSAHLARHDIIAAAFGFFAVALYIKYRISRWWICFISGFLLGLAFEIHPHSVIFGPAIVALFLLDLHWAIIKNWGFWSFIAGGMLGLGIYIYIHILPYPETYVALGKIVYTVTHTPPLVSLDLAVIFQAFLEMGHLLILIYLVLIPVVLLATILLAVSHTKADQILFVFGTTLVVGATLLIRNKIYYYSILFTPAIEIIIANFLIRFFQRSWDGRLKDYFAHVIVWGSLLGLVSLNIYAVLPDYQNDYQNAEIQISNILQPGDIIMGTQTFWFDFFDHPYYSWEQLVYYRRYAPYSTIEDAMIEFHPDIFIIDGQVNQFIADSEGASLYLEQLRIPKTELETFLNRQAKLVAEFDGRKYGPVRVYRIFEDRRLSSDLGEK